MKFNVKKLLASVMAVSMTAALAVVPVHAEDTAETTTLPGTHVTDLFNGQKNLYGHNADMIQSYYSDIYSATGNTCISFSDGFTSFKDTTGSGLYGSNANFIKRRSYYVNSTGDNTDNKFYTDESYAYFLGVNPYQSLNAAAAKTPAIPGNLMVGMTSDIYYSTADRFGSSWYDFSKNQDGGYFTMEYSLRKKQAGENASEEEKAALEKANKEFFDNLYVMCWDANNGYQWWYKTADYNGGTGGWIRSKRNYVAVKLSDFDTLGYDNWRAVKIPMNAFSEIQKDKYNYVVKTMVNDKQVEDRAIDFAHFGGIGLVWIAPNDTTAYTAGSGYDTRFDVLIGKICMEQVLAPTITKTEADGKVTISWNAVNADTSFNSKVWTGKDDYTKEQADADTAGTYAESQRNAGKYRKLIADDTLTEKITYSVYKNGKEVQNSDATTYTDTVGSRNATYYVVAHGEKKYDQRYGWTQVEPSYSVKTLALDSVKSNEVAVGAKLDETKNPKVFDLFVNYGLEWSYANYTANTDRDATTGTFNEKYDVTTTHVDFANYYLGDLGKYGNVYGKSYGYGNVPAVRSENDKLITLRVQPSRFEKNTLTTNLTSNSGPKMFDDNMNGVQMTVNETTENRFRNAAILDLSNVAETGALTFEMRYRSDNEFAATNRENILNHLYVLVRDGKNSLNYIETANGGNIDKTSNYMLVKLSDFIDVTTIAKDNWVTVNVPLSAFASADSNYHQKMYTMSTVVATPATTDPRPIDFKYFMGAGLVYVADGTETAEGKDAGVYNFDIDNMAIFNVTTPEVTSAYDAASNSTKLTWNMPNEGYATYDLYKNGVMIAEDVENGEYTDTTPDVDAVYEVKANYVVDYAKANKYSTSTSTQKLTNDSDSTAIDYATVDFDAADGVKAIGKFNPGATGVWIVVKFDKNYSVVGDVYTETISAENNQQVKEHNVGALNEGETVKSFLWNNLTEIIPKIDAGEYPVNN